MSDPSAEAKIQAARLALRTMQDRAFEASILAGAADWVITGRCPPAQALMRAGFGGRETAELTLIRSGFIRRFGFSIPSAEAVDALRKLSPLVEVGAGSGYWSAILAAAGADVIATDLHGSGDIGHGFMAGRHFPVREMGAEATVRTFPERTVFCSWPSRDERWLEIALDATAPGKRAALIVEPPGGKTAAKGLYELVEAKFELLAELALPNFPGNRDRVMMLRRRPACASRPYSVYPTGIYRGRDGKDNPLPLKPQPGGAAPQGRRLPGRRPVRRHPSGRASAGHRACGQRMG